MLRPRRASATCNIHSPGGGYPTPSHARKRILARACPQFNCLRSITIGQQPTDLTRAGYHEGNQSSDSRKGGANPPIQLDAPVGVRRPATEAEPAYTNTFWGLCCHETTGNAAEALLKGEEGHKLTISATILSIETSTTLGPEYTFPHPQVQRPGL